MTETIQEFFELSDSEYEDAKRKICGMTRSDTEYCYMAHSCNMKSHAESCVKFKLEMEKLFNKQLNW